MRRSSMWMVASVLAWFLVAGVAPAGADDQLDQLEQLIEAVKARDSDAVRDLLTQEVDVNAREGDGATALHWAAVRDDLESTSLLLDAGADVNASNDYGVTPLSLACTNRSATAVGVLLESGADPNAASMMGETPLMTCSRTGSAAAVTALLDHGAEVGVREASHGQTALMWAAAQSNPEVVRVLLAHGADLHARSDVHRLPVSLGEGDPFGPPFMEPQRGSTPLLFAVRHGHVENARLLLDAGDDVNQVAPNGQSALVLASFSGQGELAAFLLERGADPEAADAGYTALHAAVSRGDLELVKALAAHGADVNSRITKGSRQKRNINWYALSATLTGATPFWLAAKYAEVDIMRVLADNGADPLLSPENGTTPLMAVAGAGWNTRSNNRRDQGIGVDAAELLVAAGERSTWEGTKLALELGSDPNATDPDGETALHAAVRLAYPTVVDLLVEHGGDLDLQNGDGRSPRDLMCSDGAGGLLRPVRGVCPDVVR